MSHSASNRTRSRPLPLGNSVLPAGYGFLLNLQHDSVASKQFSAKNPLVLVGVGILAGHGMCALGEAGAAATCSASCQCGIQAYTRTCFAGFAEVNCTCAPCPNWPVPLPGQFSPLAGFAPISIISWQSNQFQVMDPPWLTP